MQIVTAQDGVLRTLRSGGWKGTRIGDVSPPSDAAKDAASAGGGDESLQGGGFFRTGLSVLDGLAPGQAFALGAVHELLFPPRAAPPQFVALLLMLAAARARPNGTVVWSDPDGMLYPPALARAGLPLDRLLILRPRALADEIWAAAECMNCRGVAATIVEPVRLNRVQARRLQLAAERGGGAGILIRPQRSAQFYAAATRWLVAPEPGTRTVQRWKVELLHGHGGQVHKPVILEVCRDVPPSPDGEDPLPPHSVSAYDPVADRPASPRTVARASA
jgi:protein ImuA